MSRKVISCLVAIACAISQISIADAATSSGYAQSNSSAVSTGLGTASASATATGSGSTDDSTGTTTTTGGRGVYFVIGVRTRGKRSAIDDIKGSVKAVKDSAVPKSKPPPSRPTSRSS